MTFLSGIEWGAVSDWVSAAATTAAVVVALYLPFKLAKQAERETLEGYVGLAVIVHRLTAAILNDQVKPEKRKTLDLDVRACRRAVQAIDLRAVRPVSLIEDFVEIGHMLERADLHRRAPLDAALVSEYLERSNAAIARIRRHARPWPRLNWTTR